MPRLPFKQVDVFTVSPFRGNPVAVILDADGLPGETMQRIAHWTNLSETTFVQSSERATYRLRIFTTVNEIPFAGHPTVGSAHAVLEGGGWDPGVTPFTQECGAGVLPLQVDDAGAIHVRVPRPRVLASAVATAPLAHAFGAFAFADPMIVDVGPVWLVSRLRDPSALYRLEVDATRISSLTEAQGCIGATVYAVDGDGQVHVRSFAPVAGVLEDPVCGSGNAAVATHIRSTEAHSAVGSSYTARQGAALGRDGSVHVRIDGEEIFVGGHAVTVIDGEITL